MLILTQSFAMRYGVWPIVKINRRLTEGRFNVTMRDVFAISDNKLVTTSELGEETMTNIVSPVEWTTWIGPNDIEQLVCPD